jgi:uncharacterized protein with ATP-grasp and redox domains
MRTYLDCVPCFLRQALEAARLAGADPAGQEAVLRAVLLDVQEFPFDLSPPEMGQRIHRRIRAITRNGDAYRETKSTMNQLALKWFPELRSRVLTADDPFELAVRFSLVANVMDSGSFSSISEADLQSSIESVLEAPLSDGEVDELRERASQAQRILYLGDNAGETVFDRLVIEQLPADRVTYVVRGAPILNDATMEDAETAGLTRMVPVISNGSDAPGTLLRECSPEFLEAFDRADLVIAKGQGNYETLSECGKPNLFFLLMAKCPVIARDTAAPVGSLVVRKAIPSAEPAPRGQEYRRSSP